MLDSQEGTAVMYSKGYPPLYIYKYYINIYICKHLLFDKKKKGLLIPYTKNPSIKAVNLLYLNSL